MTTIDGGPAATRRIRDDGSVLESRTKVRDDGVTSEVSLTRADGARESWIYEDSFADDARDRVRHERRAPDGALVASEDASARERHPGFTATPTT